MNENDLARRIVGRLDRRLGDLSAPVAERLAAARRTAIERYRTRGPQHATAWEWLRDWVTAHGVATRVAVPVVFVAVVAAGVVYWHQTDRGHEAVELEAALLSDELPIYAYTDPGFDAWLQHTSERQR
ncbi:MAG TPA: DUF3619 family protein [Burkholderiales bacterium]|nr:DUF3619 family protein [Burkholderiales bacterium]